VPGPVDVAQRDVTLVITLHNMLAPAGDGPPRTPGQTLESQEYYGDLFAESSDWLRGEIGRITGWQVRAVTVAVEAANGVVVLRVTGSAPGTLRPRRGPVVKDDRQSFPDSGPGAAAGPEVRPRRASIPLDGAGSKPADEPAGRTRGSEQRASATYAGWAPPRFRCASHGLQGANARYGGSIS
jgi:hypothetical protein